MVKETATNTTAAAGLTLEWSQICYTVKPGKKAEPKKVLDGVSGKLQAGKLLAIMGPSGSGKTSLLNALAGRVPLTSKDDLLSGGVTVNGQPQPDMSKISAYVMQDDNLFALSSVRQTLMFAAQLRMPSSMPLKEKEEHVDAIIAKLGLTPARDTIIGSAKARGVSGGERKRVSIGVELIHNPPLIFLDEPTSGLDSFQAQSVMETLQALSMAGHTVVASIHQPRSSIYQMCDTVCLLAEGRCCYFGPAGSPCHSHFAQLGHTVPPDFNPADFLLDLISVDYREPKSLETSRARVDAIVDTWVNQALGDSQKQASPDGDGSDHQLALVISDSGAAINSGADFCTAFPLLLGRTWREFTRNKFELLLQIGMSSFFAALFGLIYFRLDRDQTSIMDRSGLLFFQAMNGAFGSVINTSAALPLQLQVVSRERAAGMYGLLPFYVATFVVLIPIDLVPVLANASILYFITDLRRGLDHFLIFAALMCLLCFAGISLGMLVSSIIKNVEMAPRVAPAFVILFLMFSGFLLNDESVPVGMEWIKYISFIRYTFQGLAVNEFRDATFECPDSASAANSTQPVCLDGNQVLKGLSFESVEIGECFLLNFIIAGCFHGLAYMMLASRQTKFLQFGPVRP